MTLPDLSQLSTDELKSMIAEMSGGADLSALLEAWDKTPPSEKERLELEQRGLLCREVTEAGYKNFYWCITRREYPKAHYPILRGFLRAYNSKRGVMIQACRGFGKSTDLLIWVLLVLGNRPVGSMALVRINDTKAQEAGDAISKIIESNRGWKAAFPNVVPDEKSGWSKKGGFHVKDTNVCGLNDEKYNEWIEQCFADHTTEPSLTCAGLESGMLIGAHPTNGEWFDDLHDEKNTKSAAEMKSAVDIFEGNILPTWTDPKRPMTIAIVCTPWDSDNDVYAAMLRTKLLELVKIPIFTFSEDGEFFRPLNKHVTLAWPEVYTIQAVEAIWNSTDPKRFWQMFLLDDKAARENAVYKWFPFKSHSPDGKELTDWDWPIVGGVDPVYTNKKEGALSHFALCFASRTPMGNVIISGGILKKCPASEGMDYIIQAQNGYRNYQRTWCETYGGNTVFIQMVQQNPGIRINPIESKDLGNDKKGDRQYSFLQPILASGYVYISDDNTPYLNALRNYLMKYPNISDEHAPEWDAADALVAALYGLPDVRNRAVNVVDPQKWNARRSTKMVIDWNRSGYG